MTVIFDVEQLYALKRKYPTWVLLLGDKAKNPARLVGSWKDITSQSMEELQALVKRAQKSEIEAWNFGPRTGLGGLACLDWDWEFLAYRWEKHVGSRANTFTVRTPNMGYRMLYVTIEKENSSPFKRGLHMEFENGGYVALGGYAEDVEGKKQPYTKTNDAEIRVDNTILADTRAYLSKLLERYDFLHYNCISSVVNRKHITLDHNQRLAVAQFMIHKDFPDEEIHDFFRTIYSASHGRDYAFGVTQSQICSARGFHQRGGKPNPCQAKTDPDTGHISTPLFQIFGCSVEKCVGCLRKTAAVSSAAEVKERDLAEVLDWLREQFIFKTPTDLRDLYFYESGIYKSAECVIEGLLEKELGAKASTHYINEVLEHLRRGSYVDRCEFNHYNEHIPVQNGLLCLATGELKAFDHTVIYTYKFKVHYDRAAQCPAWQSFLDQVLPKEDQLLLQEFMGYCLLPTMPKHKIMWLYGKGRNGKSRITVTLEAIIGRENCSYLDLEEFDGEHRFAMPQLYGKLVNISSEPLTTNILRTNLLKKATGEDAIDGEVKGKQKRLTFCNTAKIFVLGNEFPRVTDTSVAYEDRTLIIKFPYEFRGKNQIDNIEKRWTENASEKSGILNWMLVGLNRMQANNEFTLSKTTQEMMLEFKRLSDPISAWLEENCIFDSEAYVSRKGAYEDFKAYVDEELGMTPDSERKFFQRLRDTPKIREHKGTERGFKGLRLKDPQQRVDAQTKIDSTALTADTAGNLEIKKEPDSKEINFSFAEKCAESAEPAATAPTVYNAKSSPELAEKKVLRVLPSKGEPCQATNSAGGNCGYASQNYLINAEGERSCWCPTHLKRILSGYDPNTHTINYETGDTPA
jgi:P4 family phage/plasmid primase-like protien